jgi:dTDP-4-dehydrorhamnose reductase
MKMRIMILGGDGMLGHRLFQSLLPHHDVRVTLRRDFGQYEHYNLFNTSNAIDNVDVLNYDRLSEVIGKFYPQAVVNCVGIVKQRSSAKESIPSIEINSLFPHRLSLICKAIGARFIHLSTDCVFSGDKGGYTETDYPDANDLYGRTKLLGEVQDAHCLTLRTSIIGRELSRKKSLLEWFLAQSGSIKGYTKAIYTGFTTHEMGRIIEKMIVEHPEASGVYHVSSNPISKYELLELTKNIMDHDIEIIPDASFECDRSLNSTRFRSEFNYKPPSWNAMIQEIKQS